MLMCVCLFLCSVGKRRPSRYSTAADTPQPDTPGTTSNPNTQPLLLNYTISILFH